MLKKICQRGFASKVMGGNTTNKKDSAGRRLGIKKWGNSEVRKGDIIAKQRGLKWHPGNLVHVSKDHSIHASVEGQVAWSRDRYSHRKRQRINVIPNETPNRNFPKPPPFVYHPEMYPELADMNPEPTEFRIPRVQPRRQRNPETLKCEVVEQPSQESTGFINLAGLITPQAFAQNRGYASDLFDKKAEGTLQADFQKMVAKTFDLQRTEEEVVFQGE